MSIRQDKRSIPLMDKGKNPIGETFLNNPDFAFKKLSKIVLKADVKTLMKFPSSIIYQQLMVDLVVVIPFFLTLSFSPTLSIVSHWFSIFPCILHLWWQAFYFSKV